MTKENQKILELSAAEGIIQHGARDEQSMSFIGGDGISGLTDYQHSPPSRHEDSIPQVMQISKATYTSRWQLNSDQAGL
eukprot:10817502-Karenia_brevis.AAC.2